MPISLFEWFGEAYNPGPVGSVRFGRQNASTRTRGAVSLCFLASVLGVGLIFGWIIAGSPPEAVLGNALAALLVVLLYCIAGYYIRPKPNLQNLGWLGGLFDNPFRYSDDWNRFLLWAYLLLLPGRFVAESMVDFVVMLRNFKMQAPTESYDSVFRAAIDPKRHPLYQNLLRKTQGDEKLAERLIQYEQRRNPYATREELIANAIARWERDNR